MGGWNSGKCLTGLALMWAGLHSGVCPRFLALGPLLSLERRFCRCTAPASLLPPSTTHGSLSDGTGCIWIVEHSLILGEALSRLNSTACLHGSRLPGLTYSQVLGVRMTLFFSAFFLFCFIWDKVSLHTPGWPLTPDSSSFTSQTLGSQALPTHCVCVWRGWSLRFFL